MSTFAKNNTFLLDDIGCFETASVLSVYGTVSTDFFFYTAETHTAASLQTACIRLFIKPISGCVRIVCSGLTILKCVATCLQICCNLIKSTCLLQAVPNNLQQVWKHQVVSSLNFTGLLQLAI